MGSVVLFIIKKIIESSDTAVNGNKLRTSFSEGVEHSLTDSSTISKATKIPVS